MPALDWLELEKSHRYDRVVEGTTDVVLEYAGEIRFGPQYFHLWMRIGDRPSDGRYFGPGRNVCFGKTMKLSPRFLVVERWHGSDKPDGSVMIIDTTEGREAELLRGDRELLAVALEPDRVTLTLDQSEPKTFAYPTKWSPVSWWL